MTTIEETLQAALIRIQNGQSIGEIIRDLFVNERRYREQTTERQRAEISRARREYLATCERAPKKRYPRLFVDTTDKLRADVVAHCKTIKMPVSQFVNNAVREALRRSRQD